LLMLFLSVGACLVVLAVVVAVVETGEWAGAG